MTTEERISQNEDDLEGACRDLQDTLTQVDEKLGRTEQALHPDHLIQSYPVIACCLGGALGFLIGSKADPLLERGIMLALFGYAMWRGLLEDGNEKDTAETASCW